MSDPHFGHENIIKFCKRPFNSVEEMNEGIIKRWNSVVNPEDRIYVTGDIAMSKKFIPLIGQCNGHKILIKGNHDIFELKAYIPYFEDIRAYMVEDNILISHFPVLLGLNIAGRFLGNIHGHTHEKNVPDPRYFNISCENLDYYPILLEEAKEILLNQILNS